MFALIRSLQELQALRSGPLPRARAAAALHGGCSLSPSRARFLSLPLPPSLSRSRARSLTLPLSVALARTRHAEHCAAAHAVCPDQRLRGEGKAQSGPVPRRRRRWGATTRLPPGRRAFVCAVLLSCPLTARARRQHDDCRVPVGPVRRRVL